MSETETPKMATWRKWLVGILLIVAAAAGYTVAWLDGDDTTKPDTGALIEQVGHGVDVIKGD